MLRSANKQEPIAAAFVHPRSSTARYRTSFRRGRLRKRRRRRNLLGASCRLGEVKVASPPRFCSLGFALAVRPDLGDRRAGMVRLTPVAALRSGS